MPDREHQPEPPGPSERMALLIRLATVERERQLAEDEVARGLTEHPDRTCRELFERLHRITVERTRLIERIGQIDGVFPGESPAGSTPRSGIDADTPTTTRPSQPTRASPDALRYLWVPTGAVHCPAMFVEVPPGPPPGREQYLSLLGAKWNQILREASAEARARFMGRTQSMFNSLPEPDSRSSFFADGREVLAGDEWGSVLVGNDEVREVLSGRGLLTDMNQPVTSDLHERLSDHGEPDLESILTVLENAEPSLD